MNPTLHLFLLNILLWQFLFSPSGIAQHTLNIARVSLTVSDLATVKPFYTEVLSFKEVGTYQWKGIEMKRFFGIQDSNLEANMVVLQLGEEQIELIEFVNEDQQRSIPPDSKSNDLWFQHIAIVVQDMDRAYKRLREYQVPHVSTAPQTLPEYLPAAAGISAFYFRDPDGHNLEIIHFPEGKGDPRWQKPSTDLFLGIDHTAIGIANTEHSIQFYTEHMGVNVSGNSENYGSEQEHLNQVFGSRLLITGLRAQKGIGIEFLDYLAPPGGRTYPSGSEATDLWHWHSTLVVADAKQFYQMASQLNLDIISSGLSTFQGKATFLLRDPDGHAIQIINP